MFLIRKATEADLKLLAQMNKELIQDEGSRNPMTIEQLEERMDGWILGEWEVEIIEKDNNIIGYAVYKHGKDDFYSKLKYIHLRQYYIGKDYRGRGYGTSALKQLLTHSFPEGVKVTIDVLESNPRGHNFLMKFGFSPYYTHMEFTQ
ncbi:MAG: N-acetyltransferase family protein [Bacillota bacterium]